MFSYSYSIHTCGLIFFVFYYILFIEGEETNMDIFCKIVNGEIPSKKIHEDEVVIVILDVNPRSNGHSLIIPKKHYQDLFDIDKDVLDHIMEVGKKIATILSEKLGCEGITLEQNNGISQEVKHFHLHLIPRYKKDTIMSIEDVFNRLVN